MDIKELQNKVVIKYLNYYLSLTESPDYAVLITGNWGSGKTFLIKNFLKNRDDHIYISLYGISSTDEINARICESVLLKIARSKAGEKGEKIAKKASTLIQPFIRYLKIDVNAKDLEELFSFTKDKLIIFDDLERCSIDISDTLGFINRFVEHQGNKVIILANENEILASEKYLRTKEKLIGKTLTVIEELDSAISSVIKTSSPEIKHFITTHKETIENIFIQSQCHNLRILKQVLKNLERYRGIKALQLLDHGSINYFLIVYLVLSIEAKIGNLKKGQIKLPTFFFDEKENVEKEGIDLFENKYPLFYKYELILEYATWDLIIFDGWLEEKTISNEIRNSELYQSKNHSEWKMLWYYQNFKSDSEFYECYQKVKSKLDNKQYKDIYIILHLAGIFMLFSQFKLIRQSPTQLYQYFCKYVDFLAQKKFFTYSFKDHLFKRHSPFDESNSHGLGYQGYDIPEYKEFVLYLKKVHESGQNAFYQEEANKLLLLVLEDTECFFEYISATLAKSRFDDVPILTYIDIKKLINCLPKLESKQIKLVFSALKERTSLYAHSQYTSLLEPEKTWLDSFEQQVEKQIQNHKSKIFRLKLNICYKKYFKNS